MNTGFMMNNVFVMNNNFIVTDHSVTPEKVKNRLKNSVSHGSVSARSGRPGCTPVETGSRADGCQDQASQLCPRCSVGPCSLLAVTGQILRCAHSGILTTPSIVRNKTAPRSNGFADCLWSPPSELPGDVLVF